MSETKEGPPEKKESIRSEKEEFKVEKPQQNSTETPEEQKISDL